MDGVRRPCQAVSQPARRISRTLRPQPSFRHLSQSDRYGANAGPRRLTGLDGCVLICLGGNFAPSTRCNRAQLPQGARGGKSSALARRRAYRRTARPSTRRTRRCSHHRGLRGFHPVTSSLPRQRQTAPRPSSGAGMTPSCLARRPGLSGCGSLRTAKFWPSHDLAINLRGRELVPICPPVCPVRTGVIVVSIGALLIGLAVVVLPLSALANEWAHCQRESGSTNPMFQSLRTRKGSPRKPLNVPRIVTTGVALVVVGVILLITGH